MERLYSVADIMERYHLKSRQTAAKRMKQMDTQLNTRPYLVPESAVLAWERGRTVHPPEVIRAAMRRRRNAG